MRCYPSIFHFFHPPGHSREQDPHPLQLLTQLTISGDEIRLDGLLSICERFEESLQMLVACQALPLPVSLFG